MPSIEKPTFCLLEGTKQVLFTLAEEEKVHVKTISRLFDEKR